MIQQNSNSNREHNDSKHFFLYCSSIHVLTSSLLSVSVSLHYWRGIRSVSERRTRLCLFERVPGENYYSLKILKGNIEPRRNSPGSCAHHHVDCMCADSTQNPEAKSRYSLEHQPAAEGLWPGPSFMQSSPCCSYSVLH